MDDIFPHNTFFKNENVLFIFGCLCLHCCVLAFSSCSEEQLLSSCGTDFSPQWLFFGGTGTYRHMGFCSCGAQASLPCGMWRLPGLGIKPMSPVLASEFLPLNHQGSPVTIPFEKAGVAKKSECLQPCATSIG